MWLFEIIRVAFGALVANKVRALLTMLGIIIGVGAVIAMMAMGEGAKKAVQEQIASMIDSHLTVRSGIGSSMRWSEMLTMDDCRAVRQNAQLVRTAVPQMPGWSPRPVRYRNKIAPVPVTASVPDYFEMFRLQPARGRLLTEADSEHQRRVCVLGVNVAKKLGAGPRIIGENIRVEGWFGSNSYQVVGILHPRGKASWANPDDEIVVPLETYAFRAEGKPRFFYMYMQVTDEAKIAQAAEEISRVLRRSRRLLPGKENDFTITPTIDFGALQKETSETFSSLLLGIAAVSLLVGGIGVMNIMLVSVTERTREIGIRQAVGATPNDIRWQFLAEALILSLVGGLLGVGAGVGGAIIFGATGGMRTVILPESIVLAFSSAAAVGIFFGYVPANRASKLDPIVALRHE